MEVLRFPFDEWARKADLVCLVLVSHYLGHFVICDVYVAQAEHQSGACGMAWSNPSTPLLNGVRYRKVTLYYRRGLQVISHTFPV